MDIFVGEENQPFRPDPCDYSFLQDEPDFSLSRHARLLEKLCRLLNANPTLKECKVFDESVARVVAPDLCKALGIALRKRALVTLSLFPRFASRHPDKRLLLDIAMLLAGNVQILRMDQVIKQCQPDFPIWIPMSVTDVRPDVDKPQVYGVRFFAEAGLYVGSAMWKTMSGKFLRFMLKQIGMSRRQRADDLDVMSTKLLILLSCGTGRLEFEEFSASSSQRSYNKNLFKIRHGDRPCHEGMICSCPECVMGLDRCEYAVYKTTEG